MNNLWSVLEEAWRDTLVHKAQGSALVAKSKFHLFPWPQAEASEVAWRGALHAVAWGPRGVRALTLWAVEAALSDHNEVIEVTYDPEAPYTLTRVNGTWGPRHVNRLIRTKYGLHWSVGPVVISGQADVVMSPYTTTYWDAFPLLTEGETLEAVVLPFVLHEPTPAPVDENGAMYPGRPCVVEVEFYSNSLDRFRPTYMADGFTAWKVSASTVTSRLTTPVAHDLSVDDPVYVYAQLPQTGVYAEPPPLVHKVPAPLVHGALHYVAEVPTADTVKLKSTLGGSAITLTSVGQGDFYLAVPDAAVAGDALAGHLLEDEHAIGNPTGDGPWPVYLDDAAIFAETLRSLQGTLVAGVTGVIGWAPLLPNEGWTVDDL